ncbi:hypothetical protein [Phycisphaera mikurensis]|uniref:Tetratricopeptide repeat protein n=1 Tax=Phycisphaera mikurensis (strain NBRC 102666 / KCTC 22515 / FYK2301M01) TaxID=1142394 RepID=I0IIL2_PHYMF|nr:hypothetical protein [Phycisphaera mikurensis]MBB6442747.1 hypothetical protein [Phycisphaera mikurensis]BAM05100.1 hypothetical protein PSMK_29410 [Phycisphaera mikurensis NBRC 102666]
MSPWKVVLVPALAAAGAASAAIDWTPERFGPLDRPPALRPVGEPATVLTREAFLRPKPRADAAALDAAWAALDAGRLREAEAAFAALPGDGRADLGRAVASILLGEGEAALQRCIALLRREPEALAYVNLGREARLRVARARVRLYGGLGVHARPAEPLFLMAVCDVLLRDFPLAGQHLRQARARAGAGPHLRTLGAVAESLRGGTLAAWLAARHPPAAEPMPPPAAVSLAAAAADRPPQPPRPRMPPEPPEPPEPSEPSEPPDAPPPPPGHAPDLAALIARLREAAAAVARFETRLSERLFPLIVLPPERGADPADHEP